MSSAITKKLNKIFTKIDLLAKKGKDNVYEYYKYIDELIDNGDYGYLEQVLSYYYHIDIVNTIDVSVVKKTTWKPILFHTNTSFSTKLTNLYNSKDVYQMSYNIFTTLPDYQQFNETTGLTSSSALLGQIKELDIQSPDYLKYVSNNEFAKLMGNRKTFLEVIKNGDTHSQKWTIIISTTKSAINTINPVPTFGGYGYHINDILTITTGDGAAKVQVTGISASIPANLTLISRGSYGYGIGSGQQTSGGSGDGNCTVNITSLENSEDTTLSVDQNLLNRYKIAIDVLLQKDWILTTGYWNDFGYWNDNVFWID